MQCHATELPTDLECWSEHATAPLSPFPLPPSMTSDTVRALPPSDLGPSKAKDSLVIWGWVKIDPISSKPTLLTTHRHQLAAEQSRPKCPGSKLLRFEAIG